MEKHNHHKEVQILRGTKVTLGQVPDTWHTTVSDNTNLGGTQVITGLHATVFGVTSRCEKGVLGSWGGWG